MRRKLVLGEFFGDIIEKHKRDLDPQQPKDFIDVYLLEAEKKRRGSFKIFCLTSSSKSSISPKPGLQQRRVDELHLGLFERGNRDFFDHSQVGLALPHNTPGFLKTKQT